MATVNLGRVGLVLKGDWDSATAYVPLDVVSHNGSSWAAKANSTNVEPTTEHSDSWQLLANNAEWVAQVEEYLEQAQQYSEAAVKALANQALGYSDQSTYNVGDYVLYNDVLYICKTAVTTAEAWDSTKWEQTYMADSIGDLILVQPSQPTETANKIWVDSDDETEYQVPTYEEFEAVAQDVDAIVSHEYGINWLNPAEFESGAIKPDGTPAAASILSHTGFIPVEQGDVIRTYARNSTAYSIANMRYVCAYSGDTPVPASGQDGNVQSYTVPAGINQIKVTAPNISSLITKNMDTPPSDVTPYTPPVPVISPDVVSEIKQDTLSAFEAINKTYRNVYDKTAAVVGMLDASGEVDSTVTNRVTTDFIPLLCGQQMRVKYGGQATCIYDSNKQFLETLPGRTISLPLNANCAYIRFTFSNVYVDSQAIYVGDIVLDGGEFVTGYGTYTAYEPKGTINRQRLLLAADGDSITFGHLPLTSEYPAYIGMTGGESYIDYAAHAVGCDLRKYAISSSTLALSTDGQDLRNALVERYTLMDDNADVIWIAIGSNDFAFPQYSLGEFGDTGKNTFYGALANLCQGLRTKYPTKTIIFSTPIKRVTSNTLDPVHGYPNAAGKYIDDYCKAIHDVCKIYSFPVVDMSDLCGISWTAADVTNLIPDGIHPDKAGHELMGKVAAHALSYYAS